MSDSPYREPDRPDAEPAWTLEPTHVDHAIEVVAAHCIRTPVVPATSIGHRVWLKLETEQHTGSFKVRGALCRLASLSPTERRQGVVTASAGNHGLGLAHAARRLGAAVDVYVPRGAADVKRAGMAALGANVITADADGYDATEAQARAAALESRRPFVSPFDDPWVAAGNGATVGLEVLERLPNVRTLVAPVGGGGLMAGLAAARRRTGREVALVGVQSEACPAMHRSIELGRAVETMEASETLAEGLEGGVSPTSFHHVREAVERIDLVSEAAIREAMAFAYDRLGVRCEGSAATVIAWALAHASTLPADGDVCLVVTGRNVDPDRLRDVLGR